MFASFQRGRYLTALALIAVLAWLPASASAQTCPFDGGGSDAVNDGLVLTRYALGITGAPLTASTRYASLDPLQVKNNIECVGCALDMNGDGQIDTVDTTIIARHLAGFQGASLTAGLALGAAARRVASDYRCGGELFGQRLRDRGNRRVCERRQFVWISSGVGNE